MVLNTYIHYSNSRNQQSYRGCMRRSRGETLLKANHVREPCLEDRVGRRKNGAIAYRATSGRLA